MATSSRALGLLWLIFASFFILGRGADRWTGSSSSMAQAEPGHREGPNAEVRSRIVEEYLNPQGAQELKAAKVRRMMRAKEFWFNGRQFNRIQPGCNAPEQHLFEAAAREARHQLNSSHPQGYSGVDLGRRFFSLVARKMDFPYEDFVATRQIMLDCARTRQLARWEASEVPGAFNPSWPVAPDHADLNLELGIGSSAQETRIDGRSLPRTRHAAQETGCQAEQPFDPYFEDDEFTDDDIHKVGC